MCLPRIMEDFVGNLLKWKIIYPNYSLRSFFIFTWTT